MCEEPTRRPTDRDPADGREPAQAGVLLLAGAVVAFRVAAYIAPSNVVAIPASLALPMGALGLVFLACGVGAWWVRPSGLTRTFLVYGVGMGLHWGGTVGGLSPQTDMALLVLYAAATLGADGALLDLALRLGKQTDRPTSAAAAIYVVALTASIMAPAAGFLPPHTVTVALGSAFGASFLISIVAGLIFVAKWVRASPGERHDLGLTAVVTALVVASVANLLGDAGVLPGPAHAWALSYALVPLALARSFVRGPR